MPWRTGSGQKKKSPKGKSAPSPPDSPGNGQSNTGPGAGCYSGDCSGNDRADRRLMSLLLFTRGFYPTLVRAALAGNGVTMAGAFLTRFSRKAWLVLPFGNQA